MVGATYQINGHPFTVIGVAAPGFMGRSCRAGNTTAASTSSTSIFDFVGTDRNSNTIIGTLIDLAQNMRMEVIATEGVESFEQVDLRELGVRAAQGFDILAAAALPGLPATGRGHAQGRRRGRARERRPRRSPRWPESMPKRPAAVSGTGLLADGILALPAAAARPMGLSEAPLRAGSVQMVVAYTIGRVLIPLLFIVSGI